MGSPGNILLTHAELPPGQRAIHARCYHPSGAFTAFSEEELDRSIPDRFERIVRKHAERIAVKAEDGAVSYAELNTLANRVAHAILTAYGSEPEPVALLIEKSPSLFGAMLGVLKSGKFFIPFDPCLPKTRITAGLVDSQARLMVTSRRYAGLAREVASEKVRVLELDRVPLKCAGDNLALPISPEALAYVIYTSGSTGEPKGVIQNHRNVLHLAMLRTHAYHICEHDSLAHLTSGTGNATSNAFVPLLNGASLSLFDMQAEGVSRLATWLMRERITICPIGSPLFRNFAATLIGSETFSDLRVVRLSSDAVYHSDVDLFKRYFPGHCVLATGLSSTETGFVTTYLMNHQSELPVKDPPLGYPVFGKKILLLDDHGNDVACGATGEIAVRSRYVSPGYWRRPDLSERKFLVDRAGGDERLYLSGDLGLMLSDGCLVYKGRKDFRVKIRGYGVEFAEIERALLAHERVTEALVTTRQNSAGEAELVAYLTSDRTDLTVSELRTFLEKTLPPYMIPSAFAMLESMPIAPNGKIDRRALPAIGRARPELPIPFAPPRNPVEETLAKIWAEVLAVEEVGVHDRFLDLGGTSLSATRVLSRVFKKFQLELSVQALFQSPTIAEMAGMIAEAEVKKVDGEDLTRILAEVESLSDEQAQGSLGEKAYQEPPATLTKKGRHE